MTLATRPDELLEQVVIGGDLAKLTPAERVAYYHAVCRSTGLNPLTKPFLYITLNGNLTLYAARDCTDQLRHRDNVSVTIASRELTEGIYVVTAQASLPDGRTDSSIGAVTVEGLKGEARANAFMRAETKAKRRVTLSICGLGMLDESEASSVPDAAPVRVNMETGEILDNAPPPTTVPRLQTPSAPPQSATNGPAPQCPVHHRSKERIDKNTGKQTGWFCTGKVEGEWCQWSAPLNAPAQPTPADIERRGQTPLPRGQQSTVVPPAPELSVDDLPWEQSLRPLVEVEAEIKTLTTNAALMAVFDREGAVRPDEDMQLVTGWLERQKAAIKSEREEVTV